MLTDRQKLTIEHLEEAGISSIDNIISFCIKKLNQPGRKHGGGRKGRRKHSIKYYRGILDFYAQGNIK